MRIHVKMGTKGYRENYELMIYSSTKRLLNGQPCWTRSSEQPKCNIENVQNKCCKGSKPPKEKMEDCNFFDVACNLKRFVVRSAAKSTECVRKRTLPQNPKLWLHISHVHDLLESRDGNRDEGLLHEANWPWNQSPNVITYGFTSWNR